ncbi:rRNA maturation RNase YbeY [Leeuwenhoekiella parthenopeia]|uniref:Endoribonuclease YbeY n=1 Tax=Leeuwenhoekiella parthenopeia TaxID=2890320 RepID=A0ABS8GQF4_9FLAO|nr:rRNA maturation RNase YbeY [Leeuwenhoekiella parthenopeia]MCC4212195.1 rRNA maturation RNase YbeY [Leeuwenhoekiella parthenopeia]
MIEFNSQNEFKLDKEDQVLNWLNSVAEMENHQVGELGYVFCSDEYLLDINIQYLDHDTYTDIVTFDYKEGTVLNGEMYISTDRVADNAEQFSVSFDSELRRVMVHGLLHMCGFGDKTDEDAKLMRAKEDEYLKLWDERFA